MGQHSKVSDEMLERISGKMRSVRGMELLYIDEDGTKYQAFVADAKIDKGMTIKDINNDDATHYLGCIVLKPGRSTAVGYERAEMILDMILFDQVFDWNHYMEKSGQKHNGAIGVCPFM